MHKINRKKDNELNSKDKSWHAAAALPNHIINSLKAKQKDTLLKMSDITKSTSV